MQMGDPSGNRTSSNLDHNYSQKCLPPHSANLSRPEQTTTGNYFPQFSCRIPQPTGYKMLTGVTQLSSQENYLNSKCTLPTGKQKTHIVLYTPPGSKINVFVPIDNMQETEGPNISHCVPRPGAERVNYNNSVCLQQQSSSVPADPNSSQQFLTKTTNNKNLYDMQRDLTHANATNNLPQQDPSTKRKTLPSDYRCYPTNTNAPNGQISSLGGLVYHGVRAEYSSDHTRLQAPSTCKQNGKQNNAAKKAVAVVTPLSPVEMASVNFSNKSVYALAAKSVPVHHLPNFIHPLEVNTDLRTMREPSGPTSKHQRPKSAEPRLNSDTVNSPVCPLESTNQRNHASSPKLNSPVPDQNKPAEVPKEASEKMPKDKQAVTDKKTNPEETDKYSTVPVIEWPLDKLHTLINICQQIEDGLQKNVNKTDAGKEILRLFWNGDVCKFCSTVESGIYENIMQEVYNYCPGKDGVILRQIKSDARNQVAKDFHVLKHNEVPPKLEYKSSWLNLNENLDDIDRECGISWYFRHLHAASQEHEKEISAGKLQHRSLDAPDKPSLTKHQCSTEKPCQNKVPEDERTLPKLKKTMDNQSLHEPFTSNEQFLPSQNTAVQTNMPMDSSISIENVSMVETSAGGHCLEEDLQVNAAPQEKTLSNSNPPQELDTVPWGERISVERFEDKTNNSAHTIQNPLPEASHKPSVTGQDRCPMEIVSKTPEVQTSSKSKENKSDSWSVHENLPVSIIDQPRVDANSQVPMLVTEETGCQPNAINHLRAIGNLVKTCEDKSAGTSGTARLYGGRAVKMNESTTTGYWSSLLKLKAKESQVKNSACATQIALLEGTGQQGAVAVNKVRVEKQMHFEFMKENSDCQRGGLLAETGDGKNNHLSKPESVVPEQTSCQPNAVNSLEDIANMFRKLDKCDTSLRIYENQVGKHKVLKRTGSGGRSPILTDLLMQRDLTSSPKLSPTVAEQQAQIQNKSNEKLCKNADKSITKPSITERDHCAMELVNEEAAEPHRQSSTETDSNRSMKRKRVDTEQSSHQPNIENPLAALTGIVRTIDKCVALRKHNMSKTKHQHGAKMSRWDVRSVLTEANIPSGHTNSKPVVEVQQNAVPSSQMQNKCDEQTYENNVCPQKVAMTEGKDLQRDIAGASEIMHASSRVNSVQCDKTDQQCDSSSSSRSCYDASELLQEHDMRSLEDEPKNSTHVAQNASLKFDKPSKEDLLEGKHYSDVSGLDGGACGTDDESTSENNFTSPPKLVPVEFVPSPQMQDESSDESTSENTFTSPPRLYPVEFVPSPQMHDESSDKSTSENTFTSPPKLDPVEFVPSPQMQDESTEMIPNDDCALAEENVTMCNTEEFEMDGLASIKINVLPHDVAEQWFAGKVTEDKDLQNDTDVHTSSKDQVDVEFLDHSDGHVDVNILDQSDDPVELEILDHSDDQIKVLFPEKHGEDIKPIEKNNLGAVDEKLQSYCCFAKWFQALGYGDVSLCMCHVKTDLSEQKITIEANDTTEKMETNEDCVFSKDHGCMQLNVDPLTNDENSSTLHADTPNDASVDNIKMACPVSEEVDLIVKEVSEEASETSEQIKDESPSKCEADKILKHLEKENPEDVKKSFKTVSLSLFGSSNRCDGLIQHKRYKDGIEKPPETLEITIGSHQKNDRRLSKKRKWDRSMENDDDLDIRRKDGRMSPSPKSCDEGRTPLVHKATPMKVSKVTNENVLSSSTLTRKLFNPPRHSKRLSKKKQSLGTRQVSMNDYITRTKTVSHKPSHSPEAVLKSKYELGNPALMPLQEGLGLEFKVLPSSFNFEDGTELASIQADALSGAKNEISYKQDKKAKRRKTIHAPTKGTWSFSPLKNKQSTDVSSSCSLFQEFKKKYQDKETLSRQNLNSN